jgi:ankyrin repeat protein
VKILIEKGADPSLKDNSGYKASLWAEMSGFVDVENYLKAITPIEIPENPPKHEPDEVILEDIDEP